MHRLRNPIPNPNLKANHLMFVKLAIASRVTDIRMEET